VSVRIPRGAIDSIVLDIEGTIAAIAFVTQTLFPFARRHLREHLAAHRGSDSQRDLIHRLRAEWRQDVERGNDPPTWTDEADRGLESAAAYVEWLMDRDRKSPALKLLQGRIWERGYRSGELTSGLFGDVRPAIERWRADGLRVAIYSSGSEQAQRLFVAHTRDGDLTPLFAGFFDTSVGAKTEPASYRRIAAALGCAIDRVLFVSDAPTEIDAAAEAGCHVLQCRRPGDPRQSTTSAEVIRSFDEIVIDRSA